MWANRHTYRTALVHEQIQAHGRVCVHVHGPAQRTRPSPLKRSGNETRIVSTVPVHTHLRTCIHARTHASTRMLKCINAYKGNYSKVGQHACRQSGTNSHTHVAHGQACVRVHRPAHRIRPSPRRGLEMAHASSVQKAVRPTIDTFLHVTLHYFESPNFYNNANFTCT